MDVEEGAGVDEETDVAGMAGAGRLAEGAASLLFCLGGVSGSCGCTGAAKIKIQSILKLGFNCLINAQKKREMFPEKL